MSRKLDITLKPVGDGCNLQCSHCFVAGEPQKIKLMTAKTLHNVLEKASEYASTVNVTWHGGEPLLAGIDFWKEAVKIEKALPSRFSNSVQSNLTLLDDEWAVFFRDYYVSVGTSCDGVEQIHDAYRTYGDGRGSFVQVVAGIELLRSYGLEDQLGVIACYTKFMQGRLLEVYEAMKGLDLRWRINPMIKSGRGDDATNQLATSAVDYGREFCDMVDVYLFDPDTHVIKTIDNYVERLVTSARKEKAGVRSETGCQDHGVAIDNEGNCYPCGRFTADEESSMGNINEDSFDDIMSSPLKTRIKERAYGAGDGCDECEYFQACLGGCAHDALLYSGDILGKDHICAAHQIIYSHISELLNKIKGE